MVQHNGSFFYIEMPAKILMHFHNVEHKVGLEDRFEEAYPLAVQYMLVLKQSATVTCLQAHFYQTSKIC